MSLPTTRAIRGLHFGSLGKMVSDELNSSVLERLSVLIFIEYYKNLTNHARALKVMALSGMELTER